MIYQIDRWLYKISNIDKLNGKIENWIDIQKIGQICTKVDRSYTKINPTQICCDKFN